MPSVSVEQTPAAALNPIDTIEHLADTREWLFDRRAEEEVAVELPGKWCDFGLFFSWSQELGALHFSCALDMRIQPDRMADVCTLIAILNERMWLGHFALWRDEGIPMFRYTLRQQGAEMDSRAIEDLVEIAVSECERFYPAFQFVIWGGKSADDAIDAALLDTVGEA